MTVTPESKQEFSIMLRIPGWVDNRPVPSDLYTYMNADEKKIVIKINGEVQNAPITSP